VALGLLAVPAWAAGPSAAVQAVQAAAGSKPLEAGAIRFTAIQPKGAGATIYEARRDAKGVSRTIVDLAPDAGGKWSVDSSETKVMAAETLDYFAGRIDAAIRAPGDDANCSDGPDYYAEHGTEGVAGACGSGNANAAIARALGLADAVGP
jgi:hypothetical protein